MPSPERALAHPDPTAATGTGVRGYDGRRPWALASQVALRPEPFGALAYDFDTRRLSFLKSRTLLTVVESLADHRSGDAACRAAGVETAELPAYRRALASLAESGMIRERTGS
jgi:putative mycofactocin binding protein MftB